MCIQVHVLIYVAEDKVHALKVNPKLPFFGDEKNRCASYLSACYNFSNLPSSRKSPCVSLLLHSSIRFKNKKTLF